MCVDSVESAFNAARGGASRLEVCSALSEGGLTPSPGLLTVIQENVTIPCFAIIRPRPGDFVYSDMELLAMEKDICVMIDSGAKGLVFGCLDIKGDVDVKQVTKLVSTAKSKQSDISLTFHRFSLETQINFETDFPAQSHRHDPGPSPSCQHCGSAGL